MSSPLELPEELELRSRSGSLVGVVLTPEQVQALEAESQRLREQLTAQQERVNQLVQQNEGLRRAAEAIQVERDQYLQSLYALLRKEHTFEAAEVEADAAEAEKNGIPFTEVLRGIEALRGDYVQTIPGQAKAQQPAEGQRGHRGYRPNRKTVRRRSRQ